MPLRACLPIAGERPRQVLDGADQDLVLRHALLLRRDRGQRQAAASARKRVHCIFIERLLGGRKEKA
jgi:hypothetical protein